MESTAQNDNGQYPAAINCALLTILAVLLFPSLKGCISLRLQVIKCNFLSFHKFL